MNTTQYINYNGTFYEASTPLFAADNRALKYGDGFFESMVMLQGKIPLLPLHLQRINKSAEALQIDIPFDVTETRLISTITELALKNNIAQNARVRLQFFREGKGLYAPENNTASYIITATAHNAGNFTLGEGISVGICPTVRKQFDLTSSIKTNSTLTYIMAAKWAADNGLNDALILNTNNEVCEATSSNIVIVKDNRIITPAVSSGCVAGVMRTLLINKFGVGERPLTESDVISADEVWLVNAVRGITCVKNYKQHTYKNNKAMETTASLNNMFGL